MPNFKQTLIQLLIAWTVLMLAVGWVGGRTVRR